MDVAIRFGMRVEALLAVPDNKALITGGTTTKVKKEALITVQLPPLRRGTYDNPPSCSDAPVGPFFMKLPNTDFDATPIDSINISDPLQCQQRCVKNTVNCTAFSITGGTCVLKGTNGLTFGKLINNSSTNGVTTYLPVGYHVGTVSSQYQLNQLQVSANLSRLRPCQCKLQCSSMPACDGFLLTGCSGAMCVCNLFNFVAANASVYAGNFTRVYIKAPLLAYPAASGKEIVDQTAGPYSAADPVLQSAALGSMNTHASALSLCQQDVDCDAVRIYSSLGMTSETGLYRARAERAKDIGTTNTTRSSLAVVGSDPLAGIWFAPVKPNRTADESDDNDGGCTPQTWCSCWPQRCRSG